MKYDYLVVGAGLYGAVCARELTDAGRRVLVLEKRPHVGGNCYTALDRSQLYSLYGGHIFHTHDLKLWDYINRFGKFKQYEHRVKATFGDVVYSFPPNRMTCQQLGVEPGTPEALAAIRRTFFEGYSAKHWGRPVDQSPIGALRRIPIRDSWDDRYFDAPYQGLPELGYGLLIQALLDGVHVELGVDYLERCAYWDSQALRVVYTGPVDRLCGSVFGPLEYRSLRFETAWVDGPDYQGCATMNYTDAAVPWLRVEEWRHWWAPSFPASQTLITRTFPADYDGANEPLYPVNNAHNQERYSDYRAYVTSQKPHITLGGRLGQYRYFDMDQTIAAALKWVRTETSHGLPLPA